MKYSNVVKFKIKESDYDSVVEKLSQPINFEGLLYSFVIKTGKNTCCSVGIWESESHVINARPEMITFLDSIRDGLEVLSEELGVTDPVSGPIIFEH